MTIGRRDGSAADEKTRILSASQGGGNNIRASCSPSSYCADRAANELATNLHLSRQEGRTEAVQQGQTREHYTLEQYINVYIKPHYQHHQ